MTTTDPLDDLFEMGERELRSLLDSYKRKEKSLRARIEIIERVAKERGLQAGNLTGFTMTPAQSDVLRRAALAALGKPAPALKASMSAGIVDIMRADPGKLWSADDVLQALVERGQGPQGLTPRNSVAATLSRMHAQGIVDRPSSGYYVLPPAEEGRPSLLTEDGENG